MAHALPEIPLVNAAGLLRLAEGVVEPDRILRPRQNALPVWKAILKVPGICKPVLPLNATTAMRLAVFNATSVRGASVIAPPIEGPFLCAQFVQGMLGI